MSAAETAQALNVSHQRLHQLRTTQGSPEPLANLRGGGVWDARATRRFAAEWTCPIGPSPLHG